MANNAPPNIDGNINSVQHLHSTMQRTGNWETNDMKIKIIKDITTKEVFKFVKFPTASNLAVGRKIIKLFQQRLNRVVTEEELLSNWQSYTKVIKNAMSQQRSNNTIQFGNKLRGMN